MTATQDRAGQIRTGASIEELQAALEAARRGEFAVAARSDLAASPDMKAVAATSYSRARRSVFSSNRTAISPPAPVAEAEAVAVAAQSGMANLGTTRGGAAGSDWRPAGRVVAVVAAHAGAGASTVAVTLAEALAKTGARVRLIEVADPSRSGLAAATSAELGEDGSGWRRGRRGAVTLDRLADRVASLEAVPEPRGCDTTSPETLVLDIGWPARDAFAGSGWLATALSAASVLVVFRPTVPGIRQTEYLLADLEACTRSPLTLAAIGPGRWPGAATASAGSQLRAARAGGRIVAVPLDRRIGVDGVTAEPLSKSLLGAGRRVAAALPSAVSADQPASGRAG
jgi:hypothetical protein